jgi:hypothetical protein
MLANTTCNYSLLFRNYKHRCTCEYIYEHDKNKIDSKFGLFINYDIIKGNIIFMAFNQMLLLINSKANIYKDNKTPNMITDSEYQ